MDVEDPYELERQRIIRENQALLESLGLGVNHLPIKRTSTPIKQRPHVKRTPSRTSARISSSSSVPTRRSVRTNADPLNIQPSRRVERRGPLSDFIVEGSDDEEHLKQRHGEGLGKGVALARKHNPKRFGSIPDVPVGKAWPLRAGASMDAIHAPLVACISGNPVQGAWSICFSGGYEDNVDKGTSFVLTGAGGRDLKGNGKNLRTANQSFNQSFAHPMNGALKRSAETGKPVRVVRGYKTDSEWAPLAGYRYDGLYKVTLAKLVHSSATGFKVCTFAFKRLPGQPPLRRRSETTVAVDADKDLREDVEMTDVSAILSVAPDQDDDDDDELALRPVSVRTTRYSTRSATTNITIDQTSTEAQVLHVAKTSSTSMSTRRSERKSAVASKVHTVETRSKSTRGSKASLPVKASEMPASTTTLTTTRTTRTSSRVASLRRG